MLLPWTWSWSLDLYTPNLDASKIIIMSSHEVRMSPHVIPGPWSFNTCRVFRWVVIVGLHRPGGFDIRRGCLFPEYYEVIRSLFSFFLLAVVVETSIFPQEKNPITCLLAMLEAKKFFKRPLISSLFVHTQLVYIKLLNCLTWLLDGSFGDSSCWMRMYLCINAWKPITTKQCQNLLLLFGFHKKKSVQRPWEIWEALASKHRKPSVVHQGRCSPTSLEATRTPRNSEQKPKKEDETLSNCGI